jgi:hypothetical protein
MRPPGLSVPLEAQVAVRLQEAVVPEHDELMLWQLLDALDDQLADVDEVATSKETRLVRGKV